MLAQNKFKYNATARVNSVYRMTRLLDVDLGVGSVQGGGDGDLVLGARSNVESPLSHYRHVQVVNNCNLGNIFVKVAL